MVLLLGEVCVPGADDCEPVPGVMVGAGVTPVREAVLLPFVQEQREISKALTAIIAIHLFFMLFGTSSILLRS
jgi:hypothetical protein